MVRALHQAGIEVILDVVYDHTAEGDHLGRVPWIFEAGSCRSVRCLIA